MWLLCPMFASYGYFYFDRYKILKYNFYFSKLKMTELSLMTSYVLRGKTFAGSPPALGLSLCDPKRWKSHLLVRRFCCHNTLHFVQGKFRALYEK